MVYLFYIEWRFAYAQNFCIHSHENHLVRECTVFEVVIHSVKINAHAQAYTLRNTQNKNYLVNEN